MGRDYELQDSPHNLGDTCDPDTSGSGVTFLILPPKINIPRLPARKFHHLLSNFTLHDWSSGSYVYCPSRVLQACFSIFLTYESLIRPLSLVTQQTACCLSAFPRRDDCLSYSVYSNFMVSSTTDRNQHAHYRKVGVSELALPNSHSVSKQNPLTPKSSRRPLSGRNHSNDPL